EAVTDRHFFTRKRFDRLRHAVFEDVKFTLPDVVDRFIVPIDHTYVQLDQLRVDSQNVAFLDYGRRRRSWCWFEFRWWRWLAQRRCDAIGRSLSLRSRRCS